MFEWATKSDDVIAENVVGLHSHLVAVREPLDPIYDLVTQLYDPRLWDYMQHRSKKYSKTRRYNLAVYNMTPSEARRKFAAGFSSQTASKGDGAQQSWINFVAPKAKINEIDRVKNYMQEVADQVRNGFDRSTFYRETAYQAQIADASILWGVMTIDTDLKKGRLVFRRRDPRRHWFGCDQFGDINVDHFCETMTAKVLLEKFEESVLPEKVVMQAKAENKKDPYTEYEVIQAIYDNGSRRTGSKNNIDKPYIQFYVLKSGDKGKDKTLLEKKGLDWRPSVLRIGERLYNGYPISMGMDALTPAAQGNTIGKHTMIASHALVQPPRLITKTLRDQIQSHNLAPASNTYTTTKDEKVEYLSQKVDPRYQEELLARLDGRVNDRFFIPLFELNIRRAVTGETPPTATQINREHREGILQLTAVVQSGEDDSLEPSVDAIWASETDFGNMPDDIPQELIDEAQGDTVNILNRFSGELALLKRTLRQNQGMIEAMAIIKEMKDVYPSSLVIVKAKKMLETMLVDRIGQDHIFDEREVAQIEAGLAQLAQEERQLETAERMSKIIPSVTKDAVDPNSPAALARAS